MDMNNHMNYRVRKMPWLGTDEKSSITALISTQSF